MPRRSDTRQRVLRTAAELFRRQGYHATGLNQVLSEGSAPKGSLYFHFPGGKEQLAVEAIGLAGTELCETIAAVLATAKDPVSGVDGVVRLLADDLVRSDFQHGCPLGTVAATTVDNDAIRLACAEAFAAWQRIVEQAFVAGGVPADAAPGLATMAIAAVEGGQLLARNQKDVAPLLAVGTQLREFVRTQIRKGQ